MKLPSLEVAEQVWRGEPNALLGVVVCTLARSALIAVGVALAGGGQKTWVYAVAGSAVIEVAVLAAGWAAVHGGNDGARRNPVGSSRAAAAR